MPLQGSLGHLGLADLLQTGLTGHAAGTLHLRNGAARASLFIHDEGLLLLEPDVLNADDITRAFVARGLVDGKTVEQLRAAGHAGLPLLDHLIADGLLQESELRDVLAGWAEDTILDLLTWNRGEFRFVEGPLERRRDGLVTRVFVDVGAVLLRAAQRMDERGEIVRVLGAGATLFLRLPVGPPPPEHPGDPAPRVHMVLDGRATIDEIALILGIGRFAALKAAYGLVVAGAARLADAAELEIAISDRMREHEYRVARTIVLQWVECAPTDHRPLLVLAEIARACGRVEEELEALGSLCHLLIGVGNPSQAIAPLREALQRYPHHPLLLGALRDAAEAAGDVSGYVESTLRLAENALHDAQPDRAAALLEPLARAQPEALGVRTLHGQALERSGRADEFVVAAEAVAAVIGRRCRTREQREAAHYFSEALERIAPGRNDLARRFRGSLERMEGKPRRLALVVALVVIAAGAGVVFWPASAASLLVKAEVALEAGRRAEAEEALTELLERYPDSQEAEGAARLQAVLQGARTTKAPVLVSSDSRKELAALAEDAREALGALPGAEARERLERFATRLEAGELTTLRLDLLKPLRRYVARSVHDLQRDARARSDILDRARSTAQSQAHDATALQAYLAEADSAADPWHLTALQESVAVLERYILLDASAVLRPLWERFTRDVQRLGGARTTNAEGLAACRRALADIAIDAAYRRALQDGPRALALGRLEQAQELYQGLAQLLEEANRDPNLATVWQDAVSKRIPQWLEAKRELISNIDKGLKAVQTSEAAGDLESAARAASTLLRRFSTMQIENLVPIPLEVTSRPAGARVEFNGHEVGRTPIVLHYVYGSPAGVRVSAEGYETLAHTVDTMRDEPECRLLARLTPAAIWSVPCEANVEAAPCVGETFVVVVERSGRVSLHDIKNGALRWSQQLPGVEGVKHRPVTAGGRIYVAMVGGEMAVLDPRDGTPTPPIRVGRPASDPDVLGDEVGVAVTTGELVVVTGDRIVRRVALGATPTTPVVAAHGAFWVGLADGRVARVPQASAFTSHVRWGEAGQSVRELTATPTGILATTSAGSVAAVDGSARLLWQRSGLGDLIGRPAVTGDMAAVSERRGRVLFLRSSDGLPAGGFEMGSLPRGGLLAADGQIFAALADGRLLVMEPGATGPVVDADLLAQGNMPAALAPGGRLVVARGKNLLALLPIPRPAPASEPAK